MSKIEDGGPVFPSSHTGMKGGHVHTEFRNGISIRDYFAGQALIGILSAGPLRDGTTYDLVSKCAYEHADAMLKARKGGAE